MFTQSHLASVQAARLQLIDLGDEKTAATLAWAVQPLPGEWSLTPEQLDAITFNEEQIAAMAKRAAADAPIMNKRLCRDCADFGPICPNSGRPCASDAAQAVGVDLAAGPDMQAAILVRDGKPVADADAIVVADLLDHINTLSEQLGDAAPDQRALMTKVNAWLEQREQQVQAQPQAIVPTSTDELVRVALIGDRGAGADMNEVACWQADQLARVAWAVCEYLVGKHPSEGPTPAIQEIRRAALNHPETPESSAGSITPEQLSRVLQILRVKAQAFQPYSFLLINGGVRKVEDRSGAWISRHEVIQLLDETCTDGLETALAAAQSAKD